MRTAAVVAMSLVNSRFIQGFFKSLTLTLTVVRVNLAPALVLTGSVKDPELPHLNIVLFGLRFF